MVTKAFIERLSHGKTVKDFIVQGFKYNVNAWGNYIRNMYVLLVELTHY